MVNDHRTGLKDGNIQGVLDGDLDPFIRAYLLAPREAARRGERRRWRRFAGLLPRPATPRSWPQRCPADAEREGSTGRAETGAPRVVHRHAAGSLTAPSMCGTRDPQQHRPC